KEQAIQSYLEGLKQRIVYRETPFIVSALLEIVIKGWPNESEAEELKKQGWGEDFFRNMAIHLLGELKHKPATPVLLSIVLDENELYYSRKHAMRALCKIAAPETLKPLFHFHCRELYLADATPNEKRRQLKLIDEFSFKNFSPEQALDVGLAALEEAKTSDEKRIIIWHGIAPHCEVANFAQKVEAPLKRLVAQNDDIRLRDAAASVLESIRLKRLPEEEQEKEADFRYLAKGRLEPDQVIDIDDEWVIEGARNGEAKPEDVNRVCKKYLDFIRQVAAQYDDANAFRTARLHSKGWPANVTNGNARAILQALQSLAIGTSFAEVVEKLRKLDATYNKDCQEAEESQEEFCIRFGNVIYLPYVTWFDEEFDAGFGTRGKQIEAIMVFENNRLILVHMPR
ncbi:MAG: hypothetical protein N3A66_05940, partial [Planctomycetota bacterium]|nr:hypothetical protein [Planctomycetota bacterium]